MCPNVMTWTAEVAALNSMPDKKKLTACTNDSVLNTLLPVRAWIALGVDVSRHDKYSC
jgi:hypothetical protein